MDQDVVCVPVDILYRFMQDVFIKVGVPPEDAQTVANVLIASDLRGIESHGIGRLKMYYDRIKIGIQKPVTEFEILREAPATALVDGHHGMGQVIGVRAMQLAIDKARQVGMGSVAVRNSTHYGIAGYYAQMAVEAGMVGMSVTNARPSIAPTFGSMPMLGTNPIAFGAPSDEDIPFLFDAATSIIQRGKIEVLGRKEKPTPSGWVIDKDGNPATGTESILSGLEKKGGGDYALLPLGGEGEMYAGYKGYGLATMVEIMCAALQSGNFLYGLMGFDEQGNRAPYRLGHFFMAIDIQQFVPLDEFKKTTGEILRQLRSSRKIPGHERIYTAGEKEYENVQRIRQEGIPIIPNLARDIKTIQNELSLDQYSFPF